MKLLNLVPFFVKSNKNCAKKGFVIKNMKKKQKKD